MKSKADSLIKKTDKPLATVDRGRKTHRERRHKVSISDVEERMLLQTGIDIKRMRILQTTLCP